MGRKLYQLKILLLDTEPEIWRRILISENATFWDLHVAIQDSMGWTDSHLHAFDLNVLGMAIEIGIPHEDSDSVILPGWRAKIREYFSHTRWIKYEYDFGDSWNHIIELEKTVSRKRGETYPKCIGGERTAPPEDCGGAYGFKEFLEAVTDPAHERHMEFKNWAGPFDPDSFRAEDVVFDDPKERRKRLFDYGF